MEDKASARYQHGYESRFIGSKLNAISLECVFEINPTSIRTFKGCNLVGFAVFRKQRIFRLKSIYSHPFMMFSSPMSINSTRVFIPHKEFEMVEESMRFFGNGGHSPFIL